MTRNETTEPRRNVTKPMMKPGFYPGTVNEYAEKRLADVGSLKFTSVTGTVKVQFNGGGEITVVTGDTFQAPFPFLFEQVVITASSGGSATIISGVGTFGGGGSAVIGGGAGVVGTGSPEGAVTSDPGTTYFDTSGTAFWVKATGTGTNTGWTQIV